MTARRLAVVVTGGRTFGKHNRRATKAEQAKAQAERNLVYHGLDMLNPERVLHGGAEGADAAASAWCSQHGVWQEEHPANWQQLGKAAGPIRNGQMADTLLQYKRDGWRVAVVAYPGGAGTQSMIRHAERRGITVIRPADWPDAEEEGHHDELAA